MKSSILDTEKMQKLFKNISIKQIDEDDLIWLITDLRIAIENRQKTDIYFGKVGDKYVQGLLVNVVIEYFDFNAKCSALYVYFVEAKCPANILILKNNVKSISDNPIKYYIDNGYTTDYCIVIYK